MRTSAIFLSAVLFITACQRNADQEGSEPPPLYAPPQMVEVNTSGGYTHNTVTGLAIQPIINSQGDTVRTGVSVPIKGYVLTPDSVEEPVTRKVDKPHIEHNELNVRVIPKDHKVIAINTDSLIRLSAKDDIECEACVSSIGDTIPTGVALPVKGRVVPCIQPQPVKAGAPEYKHSASLNIQLMGLDQGLDGSYVRTIVEDSRGNIWLGSQDGGVGRYDGTTFINYGEEEGLSNGVYAIVEDKRGNLWFATRDKGVCMYDGWTYTFYGEEEGLSSDYVYSMFEDSRGNIWIGNGEGVSKLSFRHGPNGGDDVALTNYTLKEGFIPNTLRGIAEDHEGNMWFGSWGGGVCRMEAAAVSHELEPPVFTHYQEKDGLIGRYINNMHVDRQGNIWFATGDGLTKFSKAVENGIEKEFFANYSEKDGLGGETVYEIEEEENGDLWIGSYGGGITKLSRTVVDGVEVETFTVHTEDDGLSTNEGGPHLVDKAGNIWSMAWGEGVSIIRNRPFRNYTLKDGLPYDRVYAVAEDNAGAIWVGTDGGGARKLMLGGDRNAQVSSYFSYPTEGDLSDGGFYNILKDRTGRIWFGDYAVSVLELGAQANKRAFDRTEYVTEYSKNEGLLWGRVHALMEDHLGNMWVGSSRRLTKLIRNGPEKGSTFRYDEEEGLIDADINTALEDADGTVWIGTDAGLSKFVLDEEGGPNGTLTHFTEKEGLCNNTVEVLFQDGLGNIWIGTGDGLDVLCLTDDGGNVGAERATITHYSTNEGLSHNVIQSIIEDNNGHIWVGTKSGLNEFVFDEGTNGRTEGAYAAKAIRHYGKFDGLKGVDFIKNSVLLDSKGRMWWGCTKSLNMLDLAQLKTSQEPPRVHLNSIAINEQFMDYHSLVQADSNGFTFSGATPFFNYPQDLVLDHDKDHLTFHFAAIDWNAPQKIQYSYSLAGLSDGWSKVSSEAKAEYRNIPHGTYTFKVRAIGESGVWSEPFEYEFTVAPPWWHTWWARALYAIVIVLAIRIFIKRRTDALKRRQLELEGEVAAATQEILEQKGRSDELLLNILPEEIAEELKVKGSAEAVHIDQVTVLFTDFKGFTAMSEQLSPKDLVKDLHECFSAFDATMEKHGIEKIKTIGDAYMAAGGLPTPNTTHATDVIKAAFEIRDFIAEGKARKLAAGLPFFEIRIGIHTGPVVAGIVGVKKFQYDIWGDTVNTASRMESSGEVGQVNISEATYALVQNEPGLMFTPRGKVQAKGKGEMEMYFVTSR